MEKTICIYHSRDLDGWCSAAIVKMWHEKNKSGEELELIGWDYGMPIPEIEPECPVIMVDVSFFINEMIKIDQQSKGKFVWIDHHTSAIKALKEKYVNKVFPYLAILPKINENLAACELTWRYFFPDQEIPKYVEMLGLYDCFRHKTLPKKESREVLMFQYSSRAYIIDPFTCYKNLVHYLENKDVKPIIDFCISQGETIYAYLCTEAKQIYAKGREFYFDGHKFIMVCRERFNPINFGIDYHKDGYDGAACFWLRKDKLWEFSLYNDNDLVDCSEICKARGGGGHKGAAGFTKKYINEYTNPEDGQDKEG